MEKSERQIIEELIIAELQSQVNFAIVFGSFYTERFNPLSDLDLAVQFNRPIEYQDERDLCYQLSQKLDRQVDLINLDRADLIISAQIVMNGTPIITNNLAEMNLWKARIFSQYPDFKRSRKVIEDLLLNRKKI